MDVTEIGCLSHPEISEYSLNFIPISHWFIRTDQPQRSILFFCYYNTRRTSTNMVNKIISTYIASETYTFNRVLTMYKNTPKQQQQQNQQIKRHACSRVEAQNRPSKTVTLYSRKCIHIAVSYLYLFCNDISLFTQTQWRCVFLLRINNIHQT